MNDIVQEKLRKEMEKKTKVPWNSFSSNWNVPIEPIHISKIHNYYIKKLTIKINTTSWKN